MCGILATFVDLSHLNQPVMTTTLSLELPETLQTTEFELKMLVAGKLYEQGRLSGGQAAGMVGVSKREFILALGRFGFSVFGYSADELRAEVTGG